MQTRLALLFILLFSCRSSLWAQDSRDTSSFYDKIHDRAGKHKVTRLIYDVIFVDPSRINAPVLPTKSTSAKKTNPFVNYQGKTIRHITIVNLDPFGFSVTDTSQRHIRYVEHFANNFHLRTRKRIITNILLFKEDSIVDPLQISESERLLRLAPYVNDARIYVYPLRKNKDSVDITVVVHDRWSTSISTNLSLTSFNLALMEKNVFGLGHQLRQGADFRTTNSSISHNGSYSIANIKNTFITGSAYYQVNSNSQQFGISFDRPFYSPIAKWAGSINLNYNINDYNYPDRNTEAIVKSLLRFTTYDLWLAKSIMLAKTGSKSILHRSSSIITGIRYAQINYFERPDFNIDTNRINSNSNLVLANFGFSRRTYYKDRYLYRFGANEDIPEGYAFEWVQGGLDKENMQWANYSALKAGVGTQVPKIGYLSGKLAYGLFYNDNIRGPGVFSAEALQFSNLFQIGTWYIREFGHLKFVNGIYRPFYESININGPDLYGFSSTLVSGKTKLLSSLEIIMYLPYKLIGFKFAPIFSFGVGTVSNGLEELGKGAFYQAYSFGVLIRNEYLITNTFSVSIGFYPYIPGKGYSVIAGNPVSNYNSRVRDYGIGRPDVVGFQ